MPHVTASRACAFALSALCAISVASCKKERGQSSAAEWIENPTSGTKSGETITFASLGVKFAKPDTLYVYKQCGEASHAPEGDHGWVPIITCNSTGDDAFGGGEGEAAADEEGEDPFASEDIEEATGVEDINVTFYVTKKTRPLDERAVQWFESQFKQAGLSVDEISFQHDFQKKSGIYAKLHVTDGSTPTREIVQFMFPRNDVVFIARMEYPFGDKRSIEQDWKYLLWNFEWVEG
ncbi:MAG: hypothetical protein IAG13_17025 [Deltaproteobacteria bacterium]|nr:hypothetical protein [Nannocystaceae bacterium]